MAAINGTENEKAYISEELYEKLSKVSGKLEEGDILVTGGGSVGNPYIVPDNKPLYTKDADLLWIKNKGKFHPYFLYEFFFSPTFRNYLGSISHVGTIAHYTITQLSDTPICLPSFEEQKEVGEYFQSLDNLITLHQRISLYFFKINTFVWEQRKLSELATMHARIGWQNLRTSEFLDAGDYMLITGTDFEDGKVNYSTCHYVEKERYDQDKNIQIKNGNILITKDGTLGKVAYVEGLSLPATLNAGVFNVEVKDENETDSKYLFQFLKAPFLMDYVSKKATGGTIKHLNQNILVDFPIATPSKAEQVRIGEYFSNLDNLITLHQRKPYFWNKFIVIDWEQRKLNEIADKVSEKNKNNEFSEPFTNSAEQGIISQKDYFDREIVNNENLNGYYIVRNDDFIYNPRISVTAPVGPINRNRLGRNGVMSPLYTVFRTHDIDNLYLEFYFKTTKWHRFMKLNGDSGARFDRFTISSTQFMEMPIPYPTLEEQQKIGEYFDSFDNLITLHQRKCEELKNIKKFMLQNMFV